MRKSQLTIGIAVTLLISAATAYVAAGMRLYAQYQSDYAAYDTVCGNLITWNPPAVVYSAFYENQPTFVTLRYRSPTPQALRISLGIPQFTQTQTIQVNAGPGFQEAPMRPPLLNGNVLDALVRSGERGADIQLSVQGPHGSLCDTSVPVTLKSRQIMHWFDSVQGDNSRYLAGWVTPDDPSIITLNERTDDWLASHPASYDGTTALIGYQATTPDGVEQQVDAIFDTLQFVYRMHYLEDNALYASDAEQIIKLPKDVLPRQPGVGASPAAMCVETTAILASAVESIGMRPYFIIVPGHAFLGVALGPSPSAHIEYWETSLLGAQGNGVSGDSARIYGDNEYASYARQHEILATIDVAAERAAGIEPIE